MKTIDFKILAKYENQYIGFSEKRMEILASATTIKELETKLGELQVNDITIEYVEPLNAYISPICQ